MSLENDFPSWIDVIKLPMPATLGKVNTYLLRDSKDKVLIDTGMNDVQSKKSLKEGLESLGVEERQISHVVCTHHHADHAGLGGTFRDLGASVLLSAQDANNLRLFFDHPDLDAHRATFNGQHPVPPEFEEKVSHFFPFFRKLAQDFHPTNTVEDLETLELAGRSLEVWTTPGHTPGHICLLDWQDKIIFTGDHILRGDATHVSMRPESQGTDPLGLFLTSLRRLIPLEGFVALPGHGAPVTDLPAQAKRVIKHHDVRLSQFESALTSSGQTAFDLSQKVMGARPKVFAQWLAMSQSLAYLEHLCQKNLARMVEENSTIHYLRA